MIIACPRCGKKNRVNEDQHQNHNSWGDCGACGEPLKSTNEKCDRKPNAHLWAIMPFAFCFVLWIITFWIEDRENSYDWMMGGGFFLGIWLIALLVDQIRLSRQKQFNKIQFFFSHKSLYILTFIGLGVWCIIEGLSGHRPLLSNPRRMSIYRTFYLDNIPLLAIGIVLLVASWLLYRKWSLEHISKQHNKHITKISE